MSATQPIPKHKQLKLNCQLKAGRTETRTAKQHIALRATGWWPPQLTLHIHLDVAVWTSYLWEKKIDFCNSWNKQLQYGLNFPFCFRHQKLDKGLKFKCNAVGIFTTHGFWTNTYNSPFPLTLTVSLEKSTVSGWKPEGTPTNSPW